MTGIVAASQAAPRRGAPVGIFWMTAILIEASFRQEHGYHGVSRRSSRTLPRSVRLATREAMSGPRDRDDGDHGSERPRRSWREIDRMRDGSGGAQERGPRGAAEQARADAASRAYRKQLDQRFTREKGGAEGQRLAKAMRDAHGTPALADACRAYRDAVGPPVEAANISLFLDCGDPELILVGLDALRSSREAGTLEPTPGLRRQLRMLVQDAHDEVADTAEEILEGI